MVTSRTCGECGGAGKMPEKKCGKCHGTTRVRSTERVKVRIPAGIDSGTSIRVAGKGEAGVGGGTYGDLYVRIQVRANDKFERHGLDIYSERDVSVVDAVLGGQVEIETIHGSVVLKIPPGTQPETVFRLDGKGIHREASASSEGAGRGNHLVKVHIVVPKKLSREERGFYEGLREEGKNVKKGWF